MSYRLEPGEQLAPGIKRIALEELDEVLQYLREPGDDVDEAVHESRKAFKKLRGLLRLVRQEIGEEVYQRENGRFRDAGRLLSELRQRAVMKTLAKEIHSLSDDLGELHDLADLRRLVAERPSILTDTDARKSLLTHIDDRAAVLQAAAFRQGQRIYTESPKAFVQRLEACWEASHI